MHRARDVNARSTRWLLACGLAGSTVFVVSFLIQGATREGYDPARNYVSSLSIGHGGWVMILTFLVTAALMAGFAVGLSRTMWSGRGSTWIPRLVGCFAAAIFFAGVFVVDPSQQYPPGSTERSTPSAHAAGHGVAAEALVVSAVAAAVIYTLRFREQKRTAWAVYTAVNALVVVVTVGGRSDPDTLGIFQRIGLIGIFSWMAAISVGTLLRLRR